MLFRSLAEFESAFARYQGVEQGSCFAVMNGVSALELTAQLCRFKPGDEVVIPSHTFTASAYPYVKKGATLKWCDVDLHTHVATAETIARAMTPKTRAVVVVHLYGYVADMPAIATTPRCRSMSTSGFHCFSTLSCVVSFRTLPFSLIVSE